MLATASLHKGATACLLAAVLLLGLLVRRSAPRAGKAIIGAALGAGLLIGGFIVDAITAPGAARTALVVTDKSSQAANGRLVVAPRWGIVDRWHMHTVDEHVAQARAHLADPALRGEPLALVAYGHTLRGRTFVVRREYVLNDPQNIAEADFDDAARAIALQMGFDVEQAQNDAPARSGMRLTAWQFEDLPSALYATIGSRDARVRSAEDVMARDGWDLVSREAHAYALPSDATAEERHAYARVREAHARWSRVDGPMESPFSPDPASVAMTYAPSP